MPITFHPRSPCPCPKTAESTGLAYDELVHGQMTIRCWDCGRFLYNEPRQLTLLRLKKLEHEENLVQ